MDRREALKTLAIASGGLIALPSWAMGWNAKSISFQPSVFTETEQALIACVADTIIPEQNSIGALSVGVDQFLVRLFEQCYEEDIQENIKNRLKKLNDLSGQANDMAFEECSQLQREELLLAFSESEDEGDTDFFNLMKSETIRGFRTSQIVMQNYLKYDLMPGHYDGCVDIIA